MHLQDRLAVLRAVDPAARISLSLGLVERALDLMRSAAQADALRLRQLGGGGRGRGSALAAAMARSMVRQLHCNLH